jgi:hypothetical protein
VHEISDLNEQLPLKAVKLGHNLNFKLGIELDLAGERAVYSLLPKLTYKQEIFQHELYSTELIKFQKRHHKDRHNYLNSNTTISMDRQFNLTRQNSSPDAIEVNARRLTLS